MRIYQSPICYPEYSDDIAIAYSAATNGPIFSPLSSTIKLVMTKQSAGYSRRE